MYFSLIGGNPTGTYQFQKGLYGIFGFASGVSESHLSSAEELQNIYAYLNAIIVVTKGDQFNSIQSIKKQSVGHKQTKQKLKICQCNPNQLHAEEKQKK